jgi:hypothetical protein
MTRECYVAVEFDGTCVTNNYPNVGEDVGADLWLRAAVAMGAKLILHTTRDHDHAGQGNETSLGNAIDWFENHDVALWEIACNPSQKSWSSSPKLHAHIYVDDCGLGIPRKRHGTRERWVVDWSEAGPALLRQIAGILNQ